MTIQEMWIKLEDEFHVHHQVLEIMTTVNGYSEETMEDILYVVSGYHSFDQLEEEER